MTPKEADQLLKVLKRHGVESFKDGEIQLTISPIKYSYEAQKQFKEEPVTEDDLYYSASPLKHKRK